MQQNGKAGDKFKIVDLIYDKKIFLRKAPSNVILKLATINPIFQTNQSILPQLIRD